jgi:uncharacterized protein (DUF4415 family)
MRSIRKLECSAEFARCNFAQSSYLNEQGKQQPMYRITKDGFMFLAMGFTGREAAKWKEAYITAFNRMEATLLTLATPERMQAALAAANAVAAQVQADVFEQLLKGGKRWQNERWMLTFHCGRGDVVTPHVTQIESDAVIMSLAYLAKAIVEPGGMLPTNAELANLSAACTKRLAQRIEFADSRKSVTGEVKAASFGRI